MPDIDTDFSIDRRDDMIKYVTERYGEDKVAQIITFNRMTSKAVLKDVARVLGIPYGEADKMAKMIPVSRGKPAKLKVMISEETPAPEFKEAYDQKMVSITDAKGESAGEIPVRQWIDMAIGIEGTNRTFGVHAAGVLISKDPLDEIVPLQRNNEGAVITQYFMEDLENLGLLKMDFLGLKNLTIIQKTAEAISQNHKIVLDPEGLPADERKAMDILAKGSQKKLPDDVKNTYKLIASGDLEGVFQLESSGMVDVVRKLKPSSIEDISSILSLYRPGPLDAGLIPKFIDRKHGREEIKYDHALLEPILNETYGVLCYQEQIMKMAQDLAGYSLGQADLLRRCLSGDTTVVDVATGNLVKIAEIADRPEYWLGRKLFSLDLNSQEIVEQPISEIHRNGRRLVWEITTRTNRKIKATQEHLFYTVLGWKPLSVLQKGDRLGLAKRLPIINAAEISDAQIKLSAYLIGDGHLSTKAPSSSYFCNSDEELIDDFNRCATELFGSPAPTDTQLHPGRKSVTYARIGFISAFNHWVDNHLKRARSEHKEIPSWVFSLSQKQLQLFLGTLWSTDGSFDKAIGHADYTSTSPVLIKQIQHLFLRLGIVALFNTKKTSYKGKPYLAYRSQITGREDMLKFCELIQPYLSSYKQQLCQASYLVVKDKLQNQSKHSIPPEIITLIGESKKASRLTWEQIDITAGVSMSSGLNFQKTPTRSLFRHRVRNFATAFQDEKLMAIAESDVFWDEIISIEYVGVEEVFDLSIPHTHNFIANDFVVHNCMGKKKVSEMEKHREMFVDGATKKGVSSKVAQNLFEQMVKFAEYCFNKSHSTAYAYVSYQTAYLKANYPVEYMAALLTANSSDQDKVQKYIANCQRFNIEVEPPDINRSKVDFTPLPKSASGNGNGKILFGLSAVKNLGETAIMEILSAREKKGPFASLAELCDRVNQQALNKRALESLIYCGAFDKLEPNRKKLIAELQDVIDWAQKRQRDRDSGQLNLFDLGIGGAAESENGFESAPQKTGIADYTAKEKLNKEKELLGFYVSDHPLKCILQANPVEDALTIAELKDQETKPKGVVKVVAMVASQKLHTTKKGDRMAFVQIEDMTGQMEAIIFPNAFEEVRSVLNEENAILLLTGKAETKDEEVQLLVEGAKAIREEMAEAVEKSYPLNIEEEAIATSSTSPIELAPVAVEAAEIETPPESEHPAKLARQARRDPSVVLVGSLEDKGEKVTVKAIGKLTRVKVITTKKGDEMAFIEIEDETGKVDVTVFPKTYDRFKHLLEEEGEETLLLVTGKTEKREDRMKLTADKLELVGVGESSGMPSPPEEYFPQTYSPPLPPEEYFEESYSPPLPPEEYFEESYSPPPPSERFVAKTPLGEKMIVIQLTLEEVADRKNLDNLKMVLQEYAAKPESALLPVAAMVVGKSCRQLVRFDRRFWVETPDVIERLKGHSLNASMSNI